MKKRLLGGVVATALLLATPAMAATTDIYRNDVLLPTKEPVLNVNDRTMMGFRDYFEATQMDVHWDDNTRTATTRFEGKDILIRPDEQQAIVNGEMAVLDTPPQIINDRIYLPLRFFGETMGYTVDFKALSGTHYEVRLSNLPVPAPTPAVQWPAGTRTIPRTQAAPASAGYYWENGSLVEIAGVDRAVERRTIDTATGAVGSQRFPLLGFPNVIDDVNITGGLATFSANSNRDLPAWPYIGQGKPAYVQPSMHLSTSMGRLPVYGTTANDISYTIDGRQLVQNHNRQSGTVVDFTNAKVNSTENRFAVADNGTTAILVDDTLLIYNQSGVQKDIPFPAKDVIAIGNAFYFFGQEGTDFALAVYDTAGNVLRPFGSLGTVAPNGPVQLHDWHLAGDTLYLLLANDANTFLATQSLSAPNQAGQFTAMGKNVRYTHFVPGLDGSLAVLAADAGNYWVSPV